MIINVVKNWMRNDMIRLNVLKSFLFHKSMVATSAIFEKVWEFFARDGKKKAPFNRMFIGAGSMPLKVYRWNS